MMAAVVAFCCSAIMAAGIYGNEASAGDGAAPVILVHPRDFVADIGQPVGFGVDFHATGPVRFQWRKDGTDLPSRTGQYLTIAAAAPGDAGDYSVMIENSFGSVISSNATLTVRPLSPPSLVLHPFDTFSPAGSSVQWLALAIGTRPFSYQWFKDGVALPGETDSALSISPLKVEHSGTYTVRVSNIAGESISPPAKLTVDLQPPMFFAHPTNQMLTAGDRLVLYSAASASPPLEYRWLKNGRELTTGGDILGADSYRLKILNLTTNDSGVYQLVASNAAGRAVSAEATVTVSPAMAIADALVRTGQSPLIWRTSHDAPWTGRKTSAFDGSEAVSGHVILQATGDPVSSFTSWLETTVVGPGVLSFWWSVTSESAVFVRQDGSLSAGLELSIDGVPVAHVTSPATALVGPERVETISGWQHKAVQITPGEHTVRWSFKRWSQTPQLHFSSLNDVCLLPPGHALIYIDPEASDVNDRLLITGDLTHTWSVQASQDLMSWSTIGDVPPSNAIKDLVDLPASRVPWQFYRASVR